jgi:hypothetical protein
MKKLLTLAVTILSGITFSAQAADPCANKIKDGAAYQTCRMNQLAAKAPTNWDYSTENDEMDSSKSKFAQITSDNSLSLAFPYQGENRGKLWVRQRKQDGLRVIFEIQKGQLICTSYNGCQIAIRFDEAQPITFYASVPSDHSSTALFINNPSRFVQLAKKAKQIRVAATVYQAGTQVLTFSSLTPLLWEQSETRRRETAHRGAEAAPASGASTCQPKIDPTSAACGYVR